jgi:hypothetical protein
MIKLLLLGIAASGILLPSAFADDLVLHNGSTFSGAVRVEGDRVTIEMDYGTMSFKRVDVKAITRGVDMVRTFEERAARAEGSKELVGVALWGREQGLSHRSDDLLNRILRLDPDQAEARRALGYERVHGQWLKDDDLRTARGLPRKDSRRDVERNEPEARIVDPGLTEEMQRLARAAEQVEIDRQGSEAPMAELQPIPIDDERNSWSGPALVPFDDPAVSFPPPPASLRPPQPAAQQASSSPTPHPIAPPSVLPPSPPWQRPILHSSQPPSYYEDKYKKEVDQRNR